MRALLVALSLLVAGAGAHAEGYKVVRPKKMIMSTPAEHPYADFKSGESPVPKLQALGLATIAREAERLKVEHGAKAFSIQLTGIKMRPTANYNKNAVIKAKVVFHYADEAK